MPPLLQAFSGGVVVILVVASCARPQAPAVGDPTLRDRMIVCSAGVESAAKTSLQAEINAQTRSGKAGVELESAIKSWFLSQIPAQDRERAYQTYVACLDKGSTRTSAARCDDLVRLSQNGRQLTDKLVATRAAEDTRREIDAWYLSVCNAMSAAQCESFLSALRNPSAVVGYPTPS
jgi:hypothetical protein